MVKKDAKKLIKEAIKKDQSIRRKLNEEGESEELYAAMARVDDENNSVIKEIIATYGVITISEFGNDVSRDAFLLVQHMPKEDLNYMENYLKAMKENSSDVNLGYMALLQDRVLVYQNKPQIYGTQVFLNQKSGKYELRDVEDPKNLNTRRYELGLESIEDYLAEF